MANFAGVKLGRKAVKTDTRTLKLASYLASNLPAPPVSVDWSHGITDWGMMLNDQLGCCTIAGCGHAIQCWSANSVGLEITIEDATILSLYEQWDGYDPKDPSTDSGGIEIDVLNDWRRDRIEGYPLLGYAAVTHQNQDMVRTAISMFGGIYIGVSLPISAQSQDVWDFTTTFDPNAEAGSWGGHCVYVVGYDEKTLTCVTWGKLQKMTWAFWKAYVDEAYALLSSLWINSDRGAPSGFSVQQLEADLKLIR